MTIYQELQLNQAGSKAVIKSSLTGKEKLKHTAIYLFKIFITMVFCMAFVIGYSKIFGDANSVVGVVILLCIMVFRFADFGIYTPHGLSSLFISLWSKTGKYGRAFYRITGKSGMYFCFDAFRLP